MIRVSRVIWDVEFEVTLIFTFDPSSGQIQVIKGQILKKKIFKNSSMQFRRRIPIMSVVLTCNKKCKKIAFQNVTSPVPVFFAVAQQKIKILAGNCVHLLLVHSSLLYIPFFYF